MRFMRHARAWRLKWSRLAGHTTNVPSLKELLKMPVYRRRSIPLPQFGVKVEELLGLHDRSKMDVVHSQDSGMVRTMPSSSKHWECLMTLCAHTVAPYHTIKCTWPWGHKVKCRETWFLNHGWLESCNKCTASEISRYCNTWPTYRALYALLECLRSNHTLLGLHTLYQDTRHRLCLITPCCQSTKLIHLQTVGEILQLMFNHSPLRVTYVPSRTCLNSLKNSTLSRSVQRQHFTILLFALTVLLRDRKKSSSKTSYRSRSQTVLSELSFQSLPQGIAVKS